VTRPAALVAGLAAAFAVALGGCGSDSASDPAPRPAETFDELPPLAGWKPHVNSSAGFAFGLPPGWEARNRGTATGVTSLDQLAVVTISADRTREALELPLEEFASRTLAARPGYERALSPNEPQGFEHPYAGVAVEAEGVAKGTGVAQRVEVVVLRRSKLVTLTAVIAVNASPAGAPSAVIAERMVATLRSRPIGGGV